MHVGRRGALAFRLSFGVKLTCRSSSEPSSSPPDESPPSSDISPSTSPSTSIKSGFLSAAPPRMRLMRSLKLVDSSPGNATSSSENPSISEPESLLGMGGETWQGSAGRVGACEVSKWWEILYRHECAHHDQLLARFVVEIDRADIGVHGSPDLGDDQSKRIFKRVSRIDVLNQAAQYLQH